MRFRSILSLFIATALFTAAVAIAQVQFPSGGKKDKEDPTIRTAQGTVRNANEDIVVGAVVQIKNVKSLQIRSFITKDDGMFTFNNLARDVDYELRAEGKGFASPMKLLSTFDNRKVAVLNLKLENKVEKK